MLLAVRNLPLANLQSTFASVDYRWMLVAIGVHAMRVGVTAGRWTFLVGDFSRGWLRRSGSNVMVGFALNNVFPFRAGDLTRIWMGRSQLDGATALAAVLILIEKLLDVGALLIFLGVGALALTSTWGTPALIILGVACLPLFPALLGSRARQHAHAMPELPADQRGIWQRVAEAGRVARRSLGWHRLAAVALLSITIWALEGLTYLCVLIALGVIMTPSQVGLILGAGNLAGVVPAMPGAWGTFELAAQSSMKLLGLDGAVAFAAAVLMHVTVYVPPTIIGSVIAGPSVLLSRRGIKE